LFAAPGRSAPVKVQVSVPDAVAGQPARAGAATVQVPEGKVSVTVTPVALPVPVLETTRVKTAFAPKVRGPLPPLVMCTAPQFTVIVADELLLPVFASAVAETVAVFGMLGQSPAVVARLRVTVRVEPFVIAPKLQDRTLAAIVQEA